MTLRDDLARVVAERRAANPRNEPGHMDYGISDAVLGVVRQAIRAQPGGIIEGEPPEDAYKRAIDGVLALFPEEHQQ